MKNSTNNDHVETKSYMQYYLDVTKKIKDIRAEARRLKKEQINVMHFNYYKRKIAQLKHAASIHLKIRDLLVSSKTGEIK